MHNQINNIIDVPGINSINLYDRAKIIGKSQNACLYGIAIERGEGNYITDVDNNRYLDFFSGASCNLIGYSREDVVETYAKTAMRLQHYCSGYNINKDTIELAEKLVDLTPGDFDKKVLFGLTGSSSIDGAIKISRKFTGKKEIIAFKGSEHGSEGLGMQASHLLNIEGLFLENGFNHIPFPTTEEDIANVLYHIKQLITDKDIGGVITEPIQGDAGICIPPKNFFKELIEILNEHDILFIVDEIQTFARTGKWWGIENFDVVPDIIVCGKGISGGYAPISAIIGKSDAVDSLEKAQHFFTYQGHPPSCAVTKKTLEIIEEEKLMDNAIKIGKLIGKELEKKECKLTKDFRGFGLMLGLEAAGENSAGIMGMRCVEHGLYPGYYGKYNEVLRLQPPLTLNEKEAHWATQILNKVINEMENKKIPDSTIDKYKKYSCGSLCSRCSNTSFEA